MNNNKKRFLHLTTAVTVVIVALAGVGVSGAVAAPKNSFVTPSVQTVSVVGGLTSQEWNQIANNAAAKGNAAAANAARQAASGTGSRGVGPQWFGAAVKAAIRAALTYGRNLLPANIRPWADKILDALDLMNDFTEGAIIIALQQVGIPYDVARGIAQWIAMFL